MITLHNTAEGTKKILLWGGISIAGLIIIITLISIGKNLKEYFYPTPPPAPTVSFGKIPGIIFPESKVKKVSFKYSLNTITGDLPKFPDRINIYKIINPAPNLLGPKRAQERAAKLGFSLAGNAISNTQYEWRDEVIPLRKFVMDISSFNFSLSSDFFSDPKIVNRKNPIKEKDALEEIKSLLVKLSSFPSDIDEEKTKITLLTIKDKNLLTATSLESAQLIRIDFFQNDKDKIPIYYPSPPFSTMYVILGEGKFKTGQPVEAKFYHHEIDTTPATYPIKMSSDAFEGLKKGQAYISSYYGEDDEISVKKVSLGYYLGENKQDYLMPIVVFEGNDGFFAYLSAVRDDWIEPKF